jgi:hypothetical protein
MHFFYLIYIIYSIELRSQEIILLVLILLCFTGLIVQKIITENFLVFE